MISITITSLKIEVTGNAFPFRKLRYYKFLTLEILMYVDYNDALKFIFSVNKATRSFFKSNASIIRNGFLNNGLCKYQFNCSFVYY